eukprot:3317795-Rhodomonas_salina.2
MGGRLREKREEVQARRSALYVADRTAQFNAFKTAAAAASHMQVPPAYHTPPPLPSAYALPATWLRAGGWA